MTKQRVSLRVGVVGAGRVGTVLGAALALVGHAVTGVSAISPASRERAATLLPGVPILEPPEVVAGADLVLLTVPDDALPELISGLAALGHVRPGQIFVHTSGRHGLSVFDALPEGVIGLALHPAMTFTGTAMDIERLRDCAFGVTSRPDLRPVAEALVLDMQGEPIWIEDSQRVRYHAALAHASNHLVTLLAQSADILREAGVENPAALLAPLVSASTDNALRQGDGALTGPIARADVGTIGAHVRDLSGLPQSDILPAYLAMGEATISRAEADRRLRADQARDLRAALDSQSPPENV